MSPDVSDRSVTEINLDEYSDLKRMATRRLYGNPLRNSVSSTSLVHESILKLRNRADLRDQEQRKRFFATIAYAMRSVLVDMARRKECQNPNVVLAYVMAKIDSNARVSDEKYLELDAALSKLIASEPDIGRVVQLKVFAAMPLSEIASQLDLSVRTIKRYWSYGIAWLKVELDDDQKK